MAATAPFQVVSATVSGLGLNFQVTTTTAHQEITNKNAPVLYVAYTVPNVPGGNSQGMAYIRIGVEASGAVATINDVGLPPNTVHLFANPAPVGTVTIGVICSVSSTIAGGAGTINVTPGQGGI